MNVLGQTLSSSDNLQEAGSELVLLFHVCSTDSQSSQALLYRLPCAGNASWLALFVVYIIIWKDGGGGGKTFWGYRQQELT